MPIVEIGSLKTIERLPGWRGQYFHTATMTVALYEFDRGATIHEHAHPEEEVYKVLEGELEVVIDRVAHGARPGRVAIVPANGRHFVRALTQGAAIIIAQPARRDFG